jgi:hypothetical protein
LEKDIFTVWVLALFFLSGLNPPVHLPTGCAGAKVAATIVADINPSRPSPP